MSGKTISVRRYSAARLTSAALFMGMNIILSLSVFSIPVPGGHLYFCDAVINTAAVLLDPAAAFAVGGIGSFLGDFFFYPAPMFVSLVTHGLQAVIVSVVSRRIFPRKQALSSSVAVLLGSVVIGRRIHPRQGFCVFHPRIRGHQTAVRVSAGRVRGRRFHHSALSDASESGV